MIHTRVVFTCPATEDNNKLWQERAAFVHCLQQAQYKRNQTRMKEDYEGENTGMDEQLKGLLSKTVLQITSDFRYLQKKLQL